jgi:TolB-like protein/DNA-binding winged helix-turn-helix (wHTH) protein/Tfp pilus assembly protein PilF
LSYTRFRLIAFSFQTLFVSRQMSPILRFGRFQLDRQNFELRCDGQPVKLDRTPLELLLFLAEHSGTLVTRDEAVEHVWGKGVFIEAESSLYTAIRKIRQALGDDSGEPQFIQTVSRKGYRFIAKVEEVRGVSPGPPVADTAGRRMRSWMLWTALACVLAAGVLLFRLRIAWHSPSRGKVMLVVLPLQNLSGDGRQDYLADGITEEIITQLGNLDPQHLGVIARTSAMQYKHARKDTAQISRELGVNYLLEGSVQRSGDRIRVTAQLIQASDQTHLWAESYDRELSDVLKLESDIAGMLAGKIRLTLSKQTDQRLAAATRVNPEAYDAYLRGLQGWNQRSQDGFLQAIADFNRATELDPNYAPAFAGLARVYSLAPIFAGIATSEAGPKALNAATRALALDETLADAHSALGFVKGHYQYDWPGAEHEFKRAIELEPNNTYGHFFYSNSFLSPFGRHEEATAEMYKAMELDPLSTRIQSFAGITFIWARRYDHALAQFQKVNQLDPNFAVNHERLARLYALLSKYEEAITEETKARLLAGETPQVVLAKMNTLRREFATKGARGYWEDQLRLSRDKQNPPEAFARPFGLAVIYCYLGDKDKALANLEIAYAERDTQMTELAIDPEFDPLRSDQRFADLEHRVGILQR